MSFGQPSAAFGEMLDGLFPQGDRAEGGEMLSGPAFGSYGAYYTPGIMSGHNTLNFTTADATPTFSGPSGMSTALTDMRDYRSGTLSSQDLQPTYAHRPPGNLQPLHARRAQSGFDLSTLSPQDSWSSSGFGSLAEASDEISPMRTNFTTSMAPPKARRLDAKGHRRRESSLTIQPGLVYGNDPLYMQPPATASSTASAAGAPYRTADTSRIKATLHAATAMVKSPEEIPLTYLNKSQAYIVSLQAAQPAGSERTGPVRYRTTVKILFDEQDSRVKVANYWKLWRDGRGVTEAIERNAEKVRAIEFDAQACETALENFRRQRQACVAPRMVSQAFDGFTIEWDADRATATSNVLNTAVAVRCHFLSTDFSHSKGVRGVTLRLAVQTEQVSPATGPLVPIVGAACAIKLFRDKGAERKSSNDLQHVRKAISKLETAVSGEGSPDLKQVKARRHSRHGSDAFLGRERAASVSSEGSLGSQGGDSRGRLFQLESMLLSTRPSTAINLPLEPHADMQISLAEEETLQRALLGAEAAKAKMRPFNAGVTPMQPTAAGMSGSTTDHARSVAAAHEAVIRPGASLVKDAAGNVIFANGVDSNYKPPPPTAVPLKVLYVLPIGSHQPPQLQSHQYASPPLSMHSPTMSEGELRPWTSASFGAIDAAYATSAGGSSSGMLRQPTSSSGNTSAGATHTAVYLHDLTGAALARAVAKKLGVAVDRPFCVRENAQGLRIVVDDDLVVHIRDGQAMTCELRRRSASATATSAAAHNAAKAAQLGGGGGGGGGDIELVLRWTGL